jgi:enediyne biosynthesis protein E4
LTNSPAPRDPASAPAPEVSSSSPQPPASRGAEADNAPSNQTKVGIPPMPFRALILMAILVPQILSVQVQGVQAQPPPAPASGPRFVDATIDAGLVSRHGYRNSPATTIGQKAAGGVAAGDYDNDGRQDLYVVCGDLARNLLFRNQGDGTFSERGEAAGVALPGHSSSGPLFFDFDGDGLLDLFVGGVDDSAPRLFRNRGDGGFDDVTAGSGLRFPTHTISATAGDHDGDGWLDLFVSHWAAVGGSCHLWRNSGRGTFSCADEAAGLAQLVQGTVDRTFTANFVDLNGDRAFDLLLTADFGQSSVWLNRGQGRLVNVTPATIDDENGMGSAVGDYDGDGHVDWFVSSIFDDDGTTEGNWGTTGNRLYRGLGDGNFQDVTGAAGVRDGNWGWASSFADFNNDGWLDLVEVNGWPQGSPQFRDTPARLFIGGPAGTFAEQALAWGLLESDDGRGLVSFDYDDDGDLDLFVANNGGPHRLWRNQGDPAGGGYLEVSVAGPARNPFAVGTLVTVTADGRQQQRQIRAGSNYVSQDPSLLHFGLGAAPRVDRLRVSWPDGEEVVLEDVPANQRLRVTPATRPSPGGGCSG